MKRAVIWFSLSLMLLYGCKKEMLPLVKTYDVISLSPTTATIEAVIESEGESYVFNRGIYWSKNPVITVDDSIVYFKHRVKNFSVTLTGLSPDSKYYAKAFATSDKGTGYGDVVSFKTSTFGSITDIDGNIYKTIDIGSQVWMAENLKTTRYRNGEIIGTTNPIELDILDQNSPKYQWENFDGSETNVSTYGRLYTWYVVADNRGLCPAGWHVPNDKEFETLSAFLGGNNVAGDKLKEAGTRHWTEPNTATNESGFTALPGAVRYFFGFSLNHEECRLWTIKEYDDPWVVNEVNALYWSLASGENSFSGGYTGKNNGFSVRCIKD